jgi:hypothetical protein
MPGTAPRASLPIDRLVGKHPALARLATRTSRTLEIALERVVANAANPREYPLPPSANSLERLIKRLYDRAPADRREQVSRRLLPRARAGRAARATQLGSLAAVDLKAPTSVLDQVAALGPNLSVDLPIKDISDILKVELADLLAPPGPPSGIKTVRASLTGLRCIETTDYEPGRDEIGMAGIAIDNLGKMTQIGPIAIGSFDKNLTVAPIDGDLRVLHTFDATQGNAPRGLAIVPFLSEVDLPEAAGTLATLISIISAVLAKSGILVPASGGSALIVVLIALTVFAALVTLALLSVNEVLSPNANLVIETNDSTSLGEFASTEFTFTGRGGEYLGFFRWVGEG